MRRYVPLWLSLLRLSLRRYPRLTVACLGCLLLDLGSFAAVGIALRVAINSATAGATASAVAGAVGLAVAYAASSICTASAQNLRNQLTERLGQDELDPELVRLVSGIEGIEHLERTDFLDRITVLRGASGGIVDSAWGAVETLLGVGRLAVMLVLLGTVEPWLLTLLIFAVLPLWSDRRSSRAVNRAATASAEAIRLQRHLFEVTTSASHGKDIRLAGVAGELIRRQSTAWADAARVQLRAQLAAAAWRAGGWTLFTAGFVGGLVFAVHRETAGHGTPGDIALIITVATNLRFAVQQTLARATQVIGAGRLLDPYLWLLDYGRRPVAGTCSAGPAPAALRQGITLDGVTHTYPGTTRPALRDVSVEIPAGSVVAIVGEYGSGKTTLVKLLCKFYRPDSGVIRVDGQDLQLTDTADWRRRISAAFQDFGRYETTIRESIGLGELASMDDTDRIVAATRAADLDGVVNRLPGGLATQLGARFGGTELSEGQWQKVALARACLREQPLLFVLDEPTASLDAPSEHAVFERYMANARALSARTGAVTVVVSHRFSTVSGADLILVMRGGRLVELGSHPELLAGAGLYASLYGIQAAAYDLSPRP